MKTTEKIYVIRDASGEYVGADGRRTPCGDLAKEYDTHAEALADRTRSTDQVFCREIAE